jgi:hypothetical protein
MDDVVANLSFVLLSVGIAAFATAIFTRKCSAMALSAVAAELGITPMQARAARTVQLAGPSPSSPLSVEAAPAQAVRAQAIPSAAVIAGGVVPRAVRRFAELPNTCAHVASGGEAGLRSETGDGAAAG